MLQLGGYNKISVNTHKYYICFKCHSYGRIPEVKKYHICTAVPFSKIGFKEVLLPGCRQLKDLKRQLYFSQRSLTQPGLQSVTFGALMEFPLLKSSAKLNSASVAMLCFCCGNLIAV